MANNVNVTEGAGKTVASEDVGGAQFQKIKVVDGTATGTSGMMVDSSGRTYVSQLVDGTVKLSSVAGTMAVYFDQSEPTVKIKTATTLAVSLDPGHELGSIKGINSSIAVYFDRGEPTVISKYSSGTFIIATDPGHELGSIKGVNSTVAIFFDQSEPTVKVKTGTTVAISLDPGHELGSIKGINSTVAVYFDPATPSVNATFASTSLEIVPTTGSRIMYDQGHQAQRVLIVGSQAAASLAVTTSLAGTMAVYFDQSEPTIKVKTGTTVAVSLDPGHELGSIKGINSTVAVYFDQSNPAVNIGAPTITGITNTVAIKASDGTFAVYFSQSEPTVKVKTGTTVAVSLDPGHELGSVKGINSTVAVYFDQSEPTVKARGSSTLVIASAGGSVSGSYTGSSDLGATIVAPEASRVIKVYAIALSTTAQVHTLCQFTNGAGAATEFWRYGLQAPTAGIAGANLAVTPPGFLFACGSNVTLALRTNNASLIHYSVAYFKETA